MEEQVKELLGILKKEKRMMVLYYMPADEFSKDDDYCGIQWGQDTCDAFSKEFNSYPKEVQVKAEQEFVSYIVQKAMLG